jgi:hypothetical protein
VRVQFTRCSGPGIGLAPFLGFVEELRWYQQRSAKAAGASPNLLLFGFRDKIVDYIHRVKLQVRSCDRGGHNSKLTPSPLSRPRTQKAFCSSSRYFIAVECFRVARRTSNIFTSHVARQMSHVARRTPHVE